jgi:hypothetical protein
VIRVLWATAAVLAILAMHGTMAHAAPPEPTAAAVAAHDDVDTPESAAPAHGEHGHDMSVLGLCAAVLATSAILLLARLTRPRQGLLAVLPRLVGHASCPRVRPDHAPPDLHALSILRC